MHVAIIMDGNGRWAEMRGLDRLSGHKAGVESVRAVTEYAAEKEIEYLSLYAFSEENWGRPRSEVDGLMELMVTAIVNERDRLMKNNIKFRAIGNLSKLSPSVLERVLKMEEDSIGNDGLAMVVFLSYSGKWDIMQAVNRYLEEREEMGDFNVTDMGRHIATAGIPDPDLLIRTGGEQRISNFMLWQIAYTEFYFTDVLWPDFRKVDFENALKSYAQRERRYGKTK